MVLRLGVLAGLLGCAPGRATLGLLDDPEAGWWAWGDPHVHSGWSYDGCEDPQAACGPVGARPGVPFVEGALAAGLDFAALVDHAEADRYEPGGAGGEALDVYAGQAEVVAELRAAGPLGLLGFEWTARRDEVVDGHARGTHRTVLVDPPGGCLDMRVAGFRLEGGGVAAPQGTARWVQDGDTPTVDTVAEMWAALDRAAAGCGGRWASFAHHPAWAVPQHTDWGLAENAPEREAVVEVLSEHGASECLDPDAEGCAWGVAGRAGDYVPEGSVQAALLAGFALGFVGGTDAHDGRAGSLDDGPGPVGRWEEGAPRHHAIPGGITGVLLDGPLDAGGLLDAIAARRTVASSGPRPRFVVALLGADGRVRRPGAEVPAEAFPADLAVEIDPETWPEGALRLRVERLAPVDGGVAVVDARELEPEGGGVRMAWTAGAEAWTYLRLRFELDGTAGDTGRDTAGSGGEPGPAREARLWVSPWFRAPTGGPGGCAAAGGKAGPGGWLVLAVLAVAARSRRLPWRRIGDGGGIARASNRGYHGHDVHPMRGTNPEETPCAGRR